MGITSRSTKTVIVAGAKEVVRQNSSAITNAVFNMETGRKAGTAIVNATRNSNIYGAAARNVASSSLKKAATASAKVNPITAAAAAVVSIAPDTIRLAQGKMGKKEFAKRSTVNVASTGGSLYGGAQGAAAGAALAGPAGAIVGAIVGGIVGGEAVRAATKKIIKIFK